MIAAQTDYIARNLAGLNTKQAKGRRKLLARMPRLGAPMGDEGTMALRLEVAERGGDQVAVAEALRIAVEGRVLIDRFDGRIMRGDRLGIIGPNGAGKSTLLKTLVGERPADDGELRVGNSIRVAYYDQQLGQVPLDKTLYEVISDLRPQWERRMVQGHLGRFGFSGDEVQRRAETLSGGERARVALAMLMLTRANLLVLDEPTNHLDVETIEVLEDAIESYEGSVILVSHDRAMLRALANKVWVLHDRHITDFDGTFAEWEVASEERAHAAAVRAAEEVALRRVDEKKRTASKQERSAANGDSQRKTLRQARERRRRGGAEGVGDRRRNHGADRDAGRPRALYQAWRGRTGAQARWPARRAAREAGQGAGDVGAGNGGARSARARHRLLTQS